MKNKFLPLVTLVSMLVLIACGGTQPKDLGKLRLAYDFWPGYYPALIAIEKGYFAEEGLQVEAIKPENTDTLMSDFIGGKYDLMAVSLGDVVNLTQLTGDVAVIFASDESAGGDAMVASSEIQSISDLKGKQIGVNQGSFAELFIVTLLEENGMTSADVTFIDMDAADAPAALRNGEVQAAHTWEPYVTEAKNDGGHVLFSSADTPGLIPDIIAVRGAVLQSNPEAVAAFVRGWFKAVDFLKANPEEGNVAAATQLGDDPATISLEGIKLNSLSDNQTLFTQGDTTASIYHTAQLYVDFFVRIGSLSQKPDLNKLLNPSFLK